MGHIHTDTVTQTHRHLHIQKIKTHRDTNTAHIHTISGNPKDIDTLEQRQADT